MPIKDPVKRAEYGKKYREAHRAEAIARTRAWREENLDYARERDREYYKEHIEERRASIKAYQKTEQGKLRTQEWYRKSYQKDREQYRCRDKFKKAIAKGYMIRKPCVICGAPDAEGHHEDYSKPYEVIWLCAWHHKEWEGKTVVPREDPEKRVPKETSVP